MTLTLLLLFIALFVGLAALGAGWFQRDEGRVMRERLMALKRATQRAPSEDLTLLRDEMLSTIPAFNRLLGNSRHIAQLQTLLSQAGLEIRPARFLLVTLSLAVVMALVPLLLGFASWMAPMTALLGVAIPFVFVTQCRKRRFFSFQSKFPDALDLLTRAVRAGHSLVTALELIAQELPDPISGEFRTVFEEQKFGMPVRDALLNLAERVPLVDVRFFVTSLLLQRETGGNLTEVLEKLAYLIRERFKLLRQVRVYTAHARVTMIMLMSLPVLFVLLMSFTHPDYLVPLYKDSLGQKLTAAAIGLQITGYLLIRNIINIRV